MFSFFDRDICVKSEYSQREFTQIFLLWRRTFVCIGEMAGEHTQGSWQICLSDQWVFAFSPKLQTLYCLSTPLWKYEHTFLPTYFLFIAGYRNLHTSVFFFLVIYWSYLRTEISVTLSTGNKLHCPLFFSLQWSHFVDVILQLHWIC